jgi:pimeloyl-ACP methyl ester carboxylesterase
VLDRINVDGLELEYELKGTGESVVLLHGGLGAVWADAFLDQPALAGRYQLLSYHRAGFAGSGRMEGPATMAAHADHCRRLMEELGIKTAHVVAHSSGASVALQLALDAPQAVHTLALLEAARPAPAIDARERFIAAAARRYQAGDPAGAVDIFFRGIYGPGYRRALDDGLPGAFEQAVSDSGMLFTQEVPALREWRFTTDEARRVPQPTLVVRGTASQALFAEPHDLLVQWLPNAEPLKLPGLTHLLHGQDPVVVAEALSGFFARHPVSEPA